MKYTPVWCFIFIFVNTRNNHHTNVKTNAIRVYDSADD
jgi:hypothetical protein